MGDVVPKEGVRLGLFSWLKHNIQANLFGLLTKLWHIYPNMVYDGAMSRIRHFGRPYYERVSRYGKQLRQSPSVKLSLLFFSAFLGAFALEYAVRWAMSGPIVRIGALVGVAIVAAIVLQLLFRYAASGFGSPKVTQKNTQPRQKEHTSGSQFPFDVLAGHHCAVIVTVGSLSQKTYLIPNVGKIIGNKEQALPDTDQRHITQTVHQLQKKGINLHLLAPEAKPHGWYMPLMGNPSKDAVRVHPFDIVFINWN